MDNTVMTEFFHHRTPSSELVNGHNSTASPAYSNPLTGKISNISIATETVSTPRLPASYSRSSSSRSIKRPSSTSSSRQSSSDSIKSAITASNTTPPSSSSETEEDDLIQLVYTSAATSRHISSDEIRTILAGSRDRNASKNITGLLLYRDGSFVQFLEGPADEVDSLYNLIERDPRHRHLIRVLRQPITKRDFRQWSMAFRDLDMIRPKQFNSANGERAFSGADIDQAHEGFSQLMNVGLKVGDHTDFNYRPDAFGNAKLDLPKNMSSSMKTMIITFYKLLDRSV